MTAAQGKAPGYRFKPKWIYVIATILMLAPLGNMLFTLASLGIPGWYKPSIWIYWTQYVQVSTWIILSLLFVSGVMLLFVRTWTFNLCLAVLGVILVYDIMMINQFKVMGFFAIASMLGFTLAFGLLLYFTEFRKPYLNPRLRWWETSPRYRVDLPISIVRAEKPATLIDISRTGVLVEWAEDRDIPDIEGSTDITLPTQAVIPVRIMRRTQRGYGFSFVSLTKTQRSDVKKFIETLAADPTKVQR